VKRYPQSSCSDDEAGIRAVNSLQVPLTDLLVKLEKENAQSVSWLEYLISVFESVTQSVKKKFLEIPSSIDVTLHSRNDVGQTALHRVTKRDLAELNPN